METRKFRDKETLLDKSHPVLWLYFSEPVVEITKLKMLVDSFFRFQLSITDLETKNIIFDMNNHPLPKFIAENLHIIRF